MLLLLGEGTPPPVFLTTEQLGFIRPFCIWGDLLEALVECLPSGRGGTYSLPAK